jgi:hypothetical protein
MHSNLVPAKKRLSSLAALCLLLCLACAMAGCKKAAPTADADTKLFVSASPEIKAAWDGALAAIQTNDYAGAYLTFQQLRAQPGVTPEQITAIDAQRKRINEQLSEAAQKGDTNAAQALAEIRNASRARGR